MGAFCSPCGSACPISFRYDWDALIEVRAGRFDQTETTEIGAGIELSNLVAELIGDDLSISLSDGEPLTAITVYDFENHQTIEQINFASDEPFAMSDVFANEAFASLELTHDFLL